MTVPAAVVVLVVEERPLRVLLVRRRGGVGFFGGFCALPGGRVEPEDSAAEHTGGDHIAHRVAALRELFEELGLLFATGSDHLRQEDRLSLRQAFRHGLEEGMTRFRAHSLRWRTGELEDIGRYVTPDFVDLRFDSRFFAMRLPHKPLMDATGVGPDGIELDRMELVTPSEILSRWGDGEELLSPPLPDILRVLERVGTLDARLLRSLPGADGGKRLRFEALPGIQMCPLRTPTLPPATHTNAFIVGTGEAVLIEPASHYPEELDRVVEWVEENARFGIRVGSIVATHHHEDHIGGAALLRERLGLPLMAHEATIERLRSKVTFDRAIEDGQRVTVEGATPMTLRAVHTPGHAPGHLCFFEERSRACIVGDMVASLGTILIEPKDGDMALYLGSLELLRALSPTVLLPAHGGPIRDPSATLTHYREHRLERERRVLHALVAHGGPATPRDLVPRAYEDAPMSVWPLAAQSVEAHLLKLVEDGRARHVGQGYQALQGPSPSGA